MGGSRRAGNLAIADRPPALLHHRSRTELLSRPASCGRLADALAEPLPATPPIHDQQAPHPDPARPAMSRSLLGAGAVVAAILLVAGVAVATVARQPGGVGGAVVAGAIIGAVLLAAVLRGHARQIAALRDLQVARSCRGDADGGRAAPS